MARIRCRKCGKKFSDSKRICPKCSSPVGSKMNLSRQTCIAIIAAILGICLVLYAATKWRENFQTILVRDYRHIASLNELLAMSSDDLAEQDLAVMNLACAENLYGAESLDVKACLQQIDEWAKSAGSLLKDREFMYYHAPEKTDHSINKWRCAALVQYLNQIIGLSYNPALKARPTGGVYDTSYFRDSRDFLIHGLVLEKKRGTLIGFARRRSAQCNPVLD